MLFDWLKTNKYSFKGDEVTLKFYIEKGWVFTVMRIDTKQMKKAPDGRYLGEITPTRFTFSCKKCIYPLRITQHSVKDKTDALFYVQGPNQMDLPKQWSWKHSYRPVFLEYRLSGGADASFAVELQSRSKWLNARQKMDPNFVPTELEWAKRLTRTDMNILENPTLYYSTMAPMDLPPGSKVLSRRELLNDYKTSYSQLVCGRRNLQNDAQLHCFDSYPPIEGGFSVRYPDNIVGRGKLFSTHYAFYPNREYFPAEADSVVSLKGLLKEGEWLTKFSRSFSKAEMTEDMVLDDLAVGQEVTYTRILPNASTRQLEVYQEQRDRAADKPVERNNDGSIRVMPRFTPTPAPTPTPTSRAIGNISPYKNDLMQRIGANWHPGTKYAGTSVLLQLVIGQDGQLHSVEVIESSGNKKTDRAAIAALEATEFAPLPNWFHGDSLTFRIDMKKVFDKATANNN